MEGKKIPHELIDCYKRADKTGADAPIEPQKSKIFQIVSVFINALQMLTEYDSATEKWIPLLARMVKGPLLHLQSVPII
jgi:hypothetical protein